MFMIPITILFLIFFLWKRGALERNYALPLMLLCLIALLLVLREQGEAEESINSIPRSGYGQGSQVMDLEAETEEGERISLSLEVPEQKLTEKEAQEKLAAFCEKLEQRMLGDNTSLNHVDADLVLEDSYEDGITAEWMSDQPELVDWTGALGEEIPEEGVTVTLSAILKLQEEESSFQRKIVVYPSRETGSLEERVRRQIDVCNPDDSSEQYLLPDSVGGVGLAWFQKKENTGLIISLLALLAAILAILAGKQKLAQQEEKRREQLEREYPDFVGRLQLLIGAGLSMRRAFERMNADYRKADAGRQEKLLSLQEASRTWYEMESGTSEADAYQHMGARCGTPSYRTLALLLTRNLRKGDAAMIRLLEQEASAAYESRKRRARMEGEKNSLRLLLPMFMMLGVVMILIMVPAFMSF